VGSLMAVAAAMDLTFPPPSKAKYAALVDIFSMLGDSGRQIQMWSQIYRFLWMFNAFEMPYVTLLLLVQVACYERNILSKIGATVVLIVLQLVMWKFTAICCYMLSALLVSGLEFS